MSRTVFTGYTVKVEGLDSLMRWMKDANPKLHKAMRKGLKEASKPVLEKARANAHFIADDGTYANSLSLGTRKGGTEYVMKSTDVAAGVKEFAKPGAVRLVGKGARSSTQRARLRAGLAIGPGLRTVRVGVPHRANPPRVMVKAVEDSADEVKDRVDECLARVLKEVENG